MTPFRLYSYLGRRVLLAIGVLYVVLTGLIILIDLIDALREVEDSADAGFLDAVQLTLFRTPKLALTLTPFIFLFGAMWAYAQLAKQSEIAVMRSAGISVWGMVTPPAILALFFGIMIVALVDPISSNLALKAQELNNKINNKQGNLLKPLQSGIWLRQRDGDTSLIMHAESFNDTNDTLEDVTFWRRSLEGVFIERWDAETTTLRDKQFVLNKAKRSTLQSVERNVTQTHTLPSAFTLKDLREDFSRPDTMSFWALPSFIQLAKDAGLPSIRYEMRFHELLCLPLKLFAMVLIAACVSMRSTRGGNNGFLILGGIAAGFLLFIASELSSATAEAKLTPVPLAAWAPAILAIVVALTLLLYTEDG